MEFRTKMVVSRRNARAYVAYAGLVIAASSLAVAFIPAVSYYYPYVFGVGIAIVVLGAIIARGDVRSYGLSTDELVVSSAGITVGAVHYPMRMVSRIDFNVEAYNGMYVNDGAMISGSNSDGITNQLTFESGGTKIEFYERRIPFVERNRSTRTYMFKVLNEKELEEFKRRYGYA
jgi:hypothetical protein